MSKSGSAHLKGINGVFTVESGDSATTFADLDNGESIECDSIQAVNGAALVISALSEANVNGDGTTTNRVTTVPAGEWIYGRFTAITVTSGTARCYRQ